MPTRRQTQRQLARQMTYDAVYNQTFDNARAEVLQRLTGISRAEAQRLSRGSNTVQGMNAIRDVLNRTGANRATAMQRQVNRTVGFDGTTPRERAERMASAVSTFAYSQPRGGSSSNSPS